MKDREVLMSAQVSPVEFMIIVENKEGNNILMFVFDDMFTEEEYKTYGYETKCKEDGQNFRYLMMKENLPQLQVGN